MGSSYEPVTIYWTNASVCFLLVPRTCREKNKVCVQCPSTSSCSIHSGKKHCPRLGFTFSAGREWDILSNTNNGLVFCRSLPCRQELMPPVNMDDLLAWLQWNFVISRFDTQAGPSIVFTWRAEVNFTRGVERVGGCGVGWGAVESERTNESLSSSGYGSVTACCSCTLAVDLWCGWLCGDRKEKVVNW